MSGRDPQEGEYTYRIVQNDPRMAFPESSKKHFLINGHMPNFITLEITDALTYAAQSRIFV